jgi:hypothetical protein
MLVRGRCHAVPQESQCVLEEGAYLGRRPPDLAGYGMDRTAGGSIQTPVQDDDLLDLGRQAAQGLSQPFVLEDACGGGIWPKAVRVGQPIGEGLPVIERCVQGQRRRASWPAGAVRRHSLDRRRTDDGRSDQARGPRP